MIIKKIIKDFSVSASVAGILAVLISFSGPGIIIFQAAKVANLSPEQLSSWIFSVSIASGIAGLFLSIKYKSPIICAWSTPGVALLISSFSYYSYSEAVGAFIISSILIVFFGISGLFETVMNKIPTGLAAALLAGILLRFGIDLFKVSESNFILFFIMVSIYFISKLISARYAVIFSLVAGISYSIISDSLNLGNISWDITAPVFTYPNFSFNSILGLALPLFIVTMVSQNVPGVAVLKASGYSKTPISPLITVTGIVSLIFSFFGSHAINLAAITAAICTSKESHNDKDKRYISGIVCGIFYIFVGLFGSTLTVLFFAIPDGIIVIISGLALLGIIVSSIAQSVENSKVREASIITFLTTASGVSLLGIGSAFWGLLFGLLVLFIQNKTVISLFKKQ